MLGIPLCSVVRLLHLSRFHSTGTVRVSPRRRMESGARGSVYSLAASQVNKTKNTSRCRDAISRFRDLCSACVYPPSLKKDTPPLHLFFVSVNRDCRLARRMALTGASQSTSPSSSSGSVPVLDSCPFRRFEPPTPAATLYPRPVSNARRMEEKRKSA